MNQWEIKQILDVVSKGVNSILMNKPDTDLKTLEKTAKGLTKIYSDLINSFKNPQEEKIVKMPTEPEVIDELTNEGKHINYEQKEMS